MLLCLSAAGQVTREVEVTKQYAPKLPPAQKLDIPTNRVDTVAIRPEIDYTIHPKSFASELTTDKFRPASVTYWQYRKNYPLFLRAGIGYPLVTEIDAYASAHRADVGYIGAYFNHRGNFTDIEVTNPLLDKSYKNNSQQMTNIVGVNGGKYIGKYTLDGDIYYHSDGFHRYALPEVVEDKESEINFENAAISLHFGDAFADLSHLNFSLYGSVDFYNDKSPQLLAQGEDSRKLQQVSATAGVKLARKLFNCADFTLGFDYEGHYGLKYLNAYQNSVLSAWLGAEFEVKQVFDVKVGVKYSYDRLQTDEGNIKHHFLPYLYLGYNLKNNSTFVPYFELDSKLVNNSFQSMQRVNPYVVIPMSGYSVAPNSTYYNMRFGISGCTLNSKFAYRLYAGASFITNSLYWYAVDNAYFEALSARENVWSICGSLEYKPISALLIRAEACGMIYNNFPGNIHIAKPKYTAELSARYKHRKFAVGASAKLVGAVDWSVVYTTAQGREFSTINYPAYVDVNLCADWYVSKQWTLFLEGRNLANATIHPWAFYRQYHIGALFGFKVQF